MITVKNTYDKCILIGSKIISVKASANFNEIVIAKLFPEMLFFSNKKGLQITGDIDNMNKQLAADIKAGKLPLYKSAVYDSATHTFKVSKVEIANNNSTIPTNVKISNALLSNNTDLADKTGAIDPRVNEVVATTATIEVPVNTTEKNTSEAEATEENNTTEKNTTQTKTTKKTSKK